MRFRLGEFDPFGDFDLLFGAARLNMKIVDLPVRYRARTYGDTKVSRFAHGEVVVSSAPASPAGAQAGAVSARDYQTLLGRVTALEKSLSDVKAGIQDGEKKGD